MILLTFLSIRVKIRKQKFLRVKRSSVAIGCLCHPEESTIAFHRVHIYGYHSHKPCSNDNNIFLLDYSYYNVYEAGCRWFFDHHWLIFTCLYRISKSSFQFSVNPIVLISTLSYLSNNNSILSTNKFQWSLLFNRCLRHNNTPKILLLPIPASEYSLYKIGVLESFALYKRP